MQWEHIAQKDPYLAGNIAARSWDWYDDTTAESESDRVHLTGEKRTLFLHAWNEERDARDKERQEAFVNEYDASAQDAHEGDPARR